MKRKSCEGHLNGKLPNWWNHNSTISFFYFLTYKLYLFNPFNPTINWDWSGTLPRSWLVCSSRATWNRKN